MTAQQSYEDLMIANAAWVALAGMAVVGLVALVRWWRRR